MNYIIRAQEYDDIFCQVESVFSDGGCDTDAIYLPLVKNNSPFFFLKHGEVNVDIEDFNNLDDLEKEL